MSVRVLRKVGKLRDKYISGEKYTPEEISFLGDAVATPLYRYIQVSVASGQEFLMIGVAEFIALSVLLHQFETIANEILLAVSVLEGVQMDTTVIKEFKDNLQLAKTRIQTMHALANNQVIWRLRQQIMAVEREIVARNT